MTVKFGMTKLGEIVIAPLACFGIEQLLRLGKFSFKKYGELCQYNYNKQSSVAQGGGNGLILANYVPFLKNNTEIKSSSKHAEADIPTS